MVVVLAIIIASILTGVIYLGVEFGIPSVLIALSEVDSWYSPTRVKPPPGQYAIMSKSRKKGDFALVIHSVRDHYIDDDINFVRGVDPRGKSWFDAKYGEKLGLVWTGFFKQYYIEKTEYAAMDIQGTAYNVVEKKRNKDSSDPYYFYQYSNMVAKTENPAEIANNQSIDMTVLFTLRHRNPWKVHFLGGKWAVRGTATVEKGMREFVRAKTIDEVRTEYGKGGNTLVAYLLDLSDNYEVTPPRTSSDPDNLTVKYGLEVDDPEFVNYQQTGSEEERKAAVAKGIASQLADAAVEENRRVITLAEGREQVTIIDARADKQSRETRAEGLRSEYSVRLMLDPTGVYSTADALRDSKLTGTIVLGNPPSSVAIPVGKKSVA